MGAFALTWFEFSSMTYQSSGIVSIVKETYNSKYQVATNFECSRFDSKVCVGRFGKLVKASAESAVS